MYKNLTVKSFSGLAALEQWAEQIDALNLASARPNPYLSAGYLRCFSEDNEYALGSEAIRLYTVWEEEQLIGCLPLRRVEDRFGPLRGLRLCFLAPFDIEQPGMLCAPEHEKPVAHALVQHLRDCEPQLGMLEFVGQRPGSTLYQTMHQAATARFRVRDIEIQPFNEVAVTWPDLASYFRALSSSWRSSVARYARKLLGAGTTEVVFAEGGQATGAWVDAFLDLESRSWKHNTSAALARDARRARLFRQVMTGQTGFTPSFVGILMDGVLIAGTMNGSNSGDPTQARGMWNCEITFDTSYADLSPGLLVLLLTMHAAIQREEKFVNLLNGFSYYKSHWKAETIPVKNVQLIRRWSLHNLRGNIGDLIRYLRQKTARKTEVAGDPSQDSKTGNSEKRTPARPDRTQARALTAQALAYDGPGIQRLDSVQLCELLPFDTRPSK